MAALVNCYTTIAKAKERLGIKTTADEAVLGTVITAVSRLLDDYCRRRFYAATLTRVFTASSGDRLLLDQDLLTVTSLKADEDGDRVYELTWATTDYDLGPTNNGVDGLPYWYINRNSLGSYWFPGGGRGIQIIGSWGYSATVPTPVAEACLAQVELNMRAPDVALGESGQGPTLVSMRGIGLHPFVRRLIDPYKKAAVG